MQQMFISQLYNIQKKLSKEADTDVASLIETDQEYNKLKQDFKPHLNLNDPTIVSSIVNFEAEFEAKFS